ncbi:hypothetical protein [endosymbiont GvMRE of Glomus versiforme]|uniref:hypothetical protein n=1 Tax=endosymbiont GvMRE of Glomus versiforme TaxID=2039283 RepID=UPI000EC7F687|nr:hypothetical protein [endosymbiont GvMRE of Glomus versiforme]RHZ35997.1 hypothetical protein GvMRE_Ic3g141 [endosymbiont GvMRE of Glomus versiforme]
MTWKTISNYGAATQDARCGNCGIEGEEIVGKEIYEVEDENGSDDIFCEDCMISLGIDTTPSEDED